MVRRGGATGATRATVSSALVWAITAALVAVMATSDAAAACRCIGPPTLLRSYYRSAVDAVVIATPQRLISSTRSTRVYGLLGGPFPVNTTVYKGCPSSLKVFSSPGSGSSCSMTFQLGVPVLLFLSAGRSVSPCDYTLPASALTAEDLAFLSRRVGCGACAAGNEVNCLVAPCNGAVQPCLAKGAKCVDNYCGGCHAEWFQADGTPLVCPPGKGLTRVVSVGAGA